MWPFKRKPKGKLIRPFDGLIGALKAKDAVLFDKLSNLPVGIFVIEWKKTHPKDFPLGGQSPATSASVIFD